MNTLLLCADTKFGVKLLIKRFVRQLKSRQDWFSEMQKDGIKSCILPSRKWFFI